MRGAPFPSRVRATEDIRDDIFKGVADRLVTAAIVADDCGVVAGTREAAEKARFLGLAVLGMLEEGEAILKGGEVARLSGSPKQIVMAEDCLVGLIAKPSGIATATRRCVDRAGGRIRIVCGAWKKMPGVLKDTIRSAIVAGGGHFRITKDPFIYLDKNYTRILGGIGNSLNAVEHLHGYEKVVQIRGDHSDIGAEAIEAAECHADIIFIDNGNPDDIRIVADALGRSGLRWKGKIAYAGNVTIEDIDRLKSMPVDILEVGRCIVDAPLLDLKFDVIGIESSGRH
jgi:nicotinate-nucleotide pyrophosphorylase (carboxylating)